MRFTPAARHNSHIVTFGMPEVQKKIIYTAALSYLSERIGWKSGCWSSCFLIVDDGNQLWTMEKQHLLTPTWDIILLAQRILVSPMVHWWPLLARLDYQSNSQSQFTKRHEFRCESWWLTYSPHAQRSHKSIELWNKGLNDSNGFYDVLWICMASNGTSESKQANLYLGNPQDIILNWLCLGWYSARSWQFGPSKQK